MLVQRPTSILSSTDKYNISKISKPVYYNTNTIERDVKQIQLSFLCFIPTYLNNLLVKQVVKAPNIVQYFIVLSKIRRKYFGLQNNIT